MEFSLQLNTFDGPLDLLLYLVRKNEFNIFDIPILKITNDFIAYVNLMKFFEMEGIGEFLVMASTLMQIKSKMLLPRDETQPEEVDETKDELIQRLIEYKKFKDLATSLEQKELLQRDIFGSGSKAVAYISKGTEILKLDLFDLLGTFKEITDKLKPEFIHEIAKDDISISQKINELLDYFTNNEKVQFNDIVAKQQNLLHKVVLFLALLELIRIKSIIIWQDKAFSDINITKIDLQAETA